MQSLHACSQFVSASQAARQHPANCVQQSRVCQSTISRSVVAFTSAPRSSVVARGSRCSCIHVKAAAAKVDSKEHLQLATARLPKGLDTTGFTNSLYQWASTLTSSGQNMPFALPIKADKLDNGFQMSLLRIKDGRPMSVGDIVANVEQVDEMGDVLFVRFFEGPASGIDRQGPAPSNSQERLQKNAEALIDVPIIMQTMKVAIQKAVAQNK